MSLLSRWQYFFLGSFSGRFSINCGLSDRRASNKEPPLKSNLWQSTARMMEQEEKNPKEGIYNLTTIIGRNESLPESQKLKTEAAKRSKRPKNEYQMEILFSNWCVASHFVNSRQDLAIKAISYLCPNLRFIGRSPEMFPLVVFW